MCRHLAYLGPERSLGDLLLKPPYSLLRQSHAPRRQRHGTVNADGFGVGWYRPGDPVPARYRSERPIWSDVSFTEIARVTVSGAVLAAVRDGTPGLPYGLGTVAPFGRGRYLFSHNGALPGWPRSAVALAGELPTESLLTLDALTDSALLWALVWQELQRGTGPAAALREVVARAAPGGGRLNLLLTDGGVAVGTTWGDTLSWRAASGAVTLASEPTDDGPGWHDVPDHSIVTATPDGVAVEPLNLTDLPIGEQRDGVAAR